MELNLIAMVKNDETISYKRVGLTKDLQKEMVKYFLKLKSKLNEKEKIDFNVEYKPEKNQIFEIKNFEIDKDIVNAVKNPLTLDKITEQDLKHIKALFCGVFDQQNNFIIFQTFDSRKIIHKKGRLNLIFDKNTFDELKKPVITISKYIDVMYENKSLIFNSFFNAKKILGNLIDYFNEATDEEIKEFSESRIVDIEDSDWFINNADSEVRKRIALIRANGVLDKGFSTIHKEAKRFGIGDYFDKKQKKIKIPKDKKKMKILLKFLNEDVFESPITKRKFITNSKRPLSGE